MFNVKTTSAPATWPVSLTEVKTHLAVTHTDDDTMLTDLFKQVTREVENYCGIALGTQTKVWTFDFDCNTEYSIPYNPVASVTSVYRKVSAGDYTELLVVNDDYDLDGQLKKTLNIFSGGRCKVTYVTGTEWATCPPDLKLGILNEIAFRYEHRGDSNKGQFSPEAFNLILRYKDFTWE